MKCVMDNLEKIQNELKYLGVDISSSDQFSIRKKIKNISNEISQNKKIFLDLWEDVFNLLYITGSNSCDIERHNLFVSSLHDLEKLIDCFSELDGSLLKKIVLKSFDIDICRFSPLTIVDIPKYRISIGWIFRYINRLMYAKQLLKFLSLGTDFVNNFIFESREKGMVVTASGSTVGGPWSNLDLPMGERVWLWSDEEENIKGTEKDKQKQERYRRGLRNYNGIVDPGDGFAWVWYENRNTPFSWYDRKTESPYPSRDMLMQG